MNLEEEKSRKEIIKKLKKDFSKTEKDERFFDEKNIGKTLIDVSANIASVISSISTIVSPTNSIVQAITNLINS